MKKIFLVILLFIFTSLSIYAVNITTLDGTEYKDAQILSRTPNGIVIECIKKGGFTTVKLLKFTELPAAAQKKYGYNSNNSNNYENNQQNWINSNQTKELAELKKSKNNEQKIIDKETEYNEMVQDNSFLLYFQAIVEVEQGTVGWASHPNQNGTRQLMGKICLLNKSFSGGMTVDVQVVQTNKKITYFGKEIPCYFAVQ